MHYDDDAILKAQNWGYIPEMDGSKYLDIVVCEA